MSASSETLTASLERSAPSRGALIFAVLSTWIIWGSTYLAVRYAVETMPALVTAGTRLLVAGTILMAYGLWKGFRPTWRHWRGALLIGTFYFLCSHGLLYFAEEHVESGTAAVIMATEPMVIAAILVFTGKERFSFWTLFGMVCGIGGVAFLVSGAGASQHSQTIGIVALVVSSSVWGVGVCVAPFSGLPEDPFASAAMTMICGAVLLLTVAAALGEFAPVRLNHISTRSWLALAFLTVFGSLVAFSSYVWLLGHVSPTLVSTHTFVNPVFAVLLGWAAAGETLSPRLVVSMVAIIGSIVLIRLGTRATTH